MKIFMFLVVTKMTIRTLCPRSLLRILSFGLHSVAAGDEPTITATVNDLCRLLSDFRSQHHDLESALCPFSSSVSPAVAEQVLKRCRHLPSPSHRFFIWSSSLPSFLHTPTSHFVLLDLLASNRLFPLSWTVISDFHPHFSHSNSFRLLFQAYSRASLPHDAIRAFRRMPDFGLQPTIDDLHHLISSLCHQGLVIPAQEFFHECKAEFSITQKTYTLLMNGWASVRKPKNAQHLFDEMLQQHLLVDVSAYNSLMAAFCRGGELDEAHKRFQEMRTLQRLEPNAGSYAVFIRAYCEAKDLNSAMRVIEHMKMHDQTPNVFTYNAIIKLLCEKKKADEAYQLLDEMIERGAKPDTWSYNAILALHCKIQEVNKALRLLSRMDRDSCLPDRHTYNMLLKMLIGIGRFDRVIEVWESMEKRGFFPSASSYAVMVHGLCRKKGKIEEACRYFEMMVDEGIPPYPSTCEVLRRELQRLGMGRRIEVLVDKMKRSTSCSIQELSNAMDASQIVEGHT
ncbi:pentatricopeptide repeat-containing protein At1g52640, mitochondrial isoform X1 [Dendrobium catenatum]|uniref:pentatricopeptide repeat-containing protein At1g52640, mitochondrial isoform X1 n=1 Tax=Dendrobium catenatum TaxID=906689 RepID=UPI0009F5B906|nr:pentatricopeptide repeat-containing protein At1g52640, mitochondrial isoform X1 [Dendrobium catenatum]XP_028554046.1 pentatricopeptide repeat-containing protein At1g52640, mitochondrial isoform X1 [Dendrobium catenatum]XP_028554047.1 pentatricopeptide repeat-containing protein At1g52640, mitochondrial isoform X1 [Dendrobium catenatum]